MAKDITGSGSRDPSIDAAVAETDPIELQDAIDALDSVAAVWAGPSTPPVLAAGRETVLTATGPDRFRTIKRRGNTVLSKIDQTGIPYPARPRLFGGFSFFDDDSLDPPWADFEPAEFVLPATQVVLGESHTMVTGFGERASDRVEKTVKSLENARDRELGTTGPFATKARASQGTRSDNGSWRKRVDPEGLRAERSAWTKRVRSVRDKIRDTDLQKVVLAAAFDLEIDGDLQLGAVMAALERQYPDCYRFSFSNPGTGPAVMGESTFFGASPERLVEKRGQTLETEALAGTVKRGESPTADGQQIDRLLGDSTLAREHELVANQITDRLGGLGADVSVGDRAVRTLANVHHLRTPITASLPQNVHVLDLVESLHPTPAVGGLPTEHARETIAEIESTVRGWYGAPIGWFDAGGDGTFAVGIRSGLARTGNATLFAGNGIVGGSDPETEWRELEAKFEPIREVLK